jgi:hypothetical protein
MKRVICVLSDGETWELMDHAELIEVGPAAWRRLESGDYPKHIFNDLGISIPWLWRLSVWLQAHYPKIYAEFRDHEKRREERLKKRG